MKKFLILWRHWFWAEGDGELKWTTNGTMSLEVYARTKNEAIENFLSAPRSRDVVAEIEYIKEIND